MPFRSTSEIKRSSWGCEMSSACIGSGGKWGERYGGWGGGGGGGGGGGIVGE